MTARMDEESGLERRARAVLAESVARIDARTRSRLNRARQAALAAANEPRPHFRLSLGAGMVPIAGALAAAVLAVALTLFMRGSPHPAVRTDAAQPSVEVLDMLADEDNIALMENYDHSFYEWAAAEAADGDASGGGGGATGGNTNGNTSGGASGEASG